MGKPVFHVEQNEYGAWYVYRNGLNVALITPRLWQIAPGVFIPAGYRMASNNPAFRDIEPEWSDMYAWCMRCEAVHKARNEMELGA